MIVRRRIGDDDGNEVYREGTRRVDVNPRFCIYVLYVTFGEERGLKIAQDLYSRS